MDDDLRFQVFKGTLELHSYATLSELTEEGVRIVFSPARMNGEGRRATTGGRPYGRCAVVGGERNPGVGDDRDGVLRV